MQLKNPAGAVRLGLMAASCALLSAPAAAEDSGTGDAPWQADTGLLAYHENGGRITAVEPEVQLRHDLGDEHVLALTGVVDALTGGSPNGALPSKSAQTFATPSGTTLQPTGTTHNSKLYTTAPGQLPMDPNFRNERIAGDLAWSQPFGAAEHLTAGGHLSKEHDFFSASAHLDLAHDLNDKNTTLGFGINGESDRVDPVGGAPVAGSNYALLEHTGHESKTQASALLGVTQVMTRTWLAQLNVSYDRANGYLTDPYKILSVLDAAGGTSGYVYEHRPNERARKGLYAGSKFALGSSVLDISYRYTTDDWQVKTDTVEARLRFNVGQGGTYLEPHVRAYRQSAADFYHLYLDGTAALPTYASSDSRLAALNGITVGIKVGFVLEDHSEVSVRLEGYQQRPTTNSSNLPLLQGLDLNPGLKTIMLQVSWHNGVL
jgi:hypothetical protein